MALVSEALQCSREELEGHNVGIIHDIYIFCDVEQVAQCIYKCTQKAKWLGALSQEHFLQVILLHVEIQNGTGFKPGSERQQDYQHLF